MFFKRKSSIIFRNYVRFGYIVDGSDFIYKKVGGNANYIGDKILSESGATFFSVLDRKPQSICDLAKKINEKYASVDISTIKDDAAEFYMMLERDGFVVFGETDRECDEKDKGFTYKASTQDAVKTDLSWTSVRPTKSTVDFFDEYYDGMPLLTNLHVEIISKCNERCVHCYIPHDSKTDVIDPVLFYDVLEQCRYMGVLHLTLTGGEPMLHKNFCDFLKKCRENDFAISVLTNLTLINYDIIKEMKRNSLLGVQTSLYAMDPDVHDEITKVRGSFEKTKNGILTLIENDIPLQISCPIIKQNKDCYSDVVKWARKYGISVDGDPAIIAEYDHTTKNLDCRLSIDDVISVIYDKSVDDKDYFRRMEANLEGKDKVSPDEHICSVCSSSICIAQNGNVYPCAGWQDYVVGNVKKSSLREIWNDSKGVRYLRNLRRGDFPKCIQCPDKDYCTMCMVRNANEHPQGDPLVVNEYYCKIANANRRMMLEWKRGLMRS